MPMRSGGGVLLVSSLQLIVGIVFLGLYEGYKARGSHEATVSACACVCLSCCALTRSGTTQTVNATLQRKYILHQSLAANVPGSPGTTQDYASESYASAVSSFLGCVLCFDRAQGALRPHANYHHFACPLAQVLQAHGVAFPPSHRK